jgi:hypothetical protein
MMGLLSKSASSFWLLAPALVFFVVFLTLWAVGAAKVADRDPDGDSHSQPRRNVAGGHA